MLNTNNGETIGSSPRLRGTCARTLERRSPHRFIPAPAGNIFEGTSPSQHKAVHPRACGEHNWSVHIESIRDGSSPRLRGTFDVRHNSLEIERFIPAPAGNMRLAKRVISRPTVHPRACGEHCQRIPRPLSCSGSSPRLRGTLRRARQRTRRCRFIPAPAGNM